MALVSLAEACRVFEELPAALRLPTLNPLYCAADSHRDPRLIPRFLLFRRGSGLLLHSLLESAVPGGGVDWQSPYGYGGPIAVGMDDDLLREAWSRFDAVALEQGVVAEFLRFHPLADNHLLYPGVVREDRRVVAVDLAEIDLATSYSVRGRNAIRKGQQAGLRVAWESPCGFRQSFATLYREAMQRIGAGDFYLFNDDYFSHLFGLPGIRPVAVRREERLVAAAVFLFGPRVVEYHLSATTPEGRSAGATNVLLHEAASVGHREGRTTLYLGGGTDSRPDNPLLRFKESFAPADRQFRFGFRILNAARYEDLKQQFPQQAQSRRVLFYRDN